MATGFELMLAAALCLSCPHKWDMHPEGFLHLNDKGELITYLDVEHVKGTLETPVEDIPVETLETLVLKAEKLNALKEWIKGRHLRIATLEDYPLSYTKKMGNGTVVGLGVSFELIDFLMEKFNFTYEVIVPEGNIIGSKTDFSNSLIEMLNKSNADMAAAFLPILSEQRSFVFYSTTTLDEGEWIMVMRRPSESATGSGLTAPFDYWVWVLIFVSLFAVGPIIYGLIILRNKLTGDTEQKPYSLGHCAWFVYGALMKQGSILSPIAVLNLERNLFGPFGVVLALFIAYFGLKLKFGNTNTDSHYSTRSFLLLFLTFYFLSGVRNKRLAELEFYNVDTNVILKQNFEENCCNKIANVDEDILYGDLYISYKNMWYIKIFE